MKLLTPQQMKMIDKTAIDQLGIPGIVLMENAALQVVAKASGLIKNKKDAKITVVAGPGNNGGDAFAVARHLLLMGYTVSVYSSCGIEDIAGDALINAKILLNMGLSIPVLCDEESLKRLEVSCLESDLVIDGLLGTGLNRNVEGMLDRVIDTINENSRLILSIDIASGVDGLTGEVRGNCIKADATVTFFMPKVGMVQYPGADYMGELTVADIGIPYALAEDLNTPWLLEKSDIKALMPERPDNSHKGTFGKVLAVAGSKGMAGAAYLCAAAAYRTGTGLFKLAVPESLWSTVSTLIPEAVIELMPEKDGHIHINDGSLLKNLVENADAVLVGPGLSCNDDTLNLLKTLFDCCEKPMVLDADALNILAGDKTLLENIRGEAVITPHPAEMARLAGLTVEEVQKNRLEVAGKFADEFGLTVVLKGAGTVIASNDGRIAINPTGNNGMATAGAGDVLAGMIVSLLGQGLAPFEASCMGVYMHGLSGDLAAGKKGTTSLMASDIVDNIPTAFKHILK